MLNNRKHIGLNKGFNSTFGVITSGIPPSNTVAPSISGTNQVGFVLTAVNGTYTGTTPITITGNWQRDGVNIVGETNLTYTQVSADIGTSIRWQETASNGFLPNAVTNSNVIATTGTAPTNTVAPVVSGTLEVGQTLTSTTGTWTGTPTITYSYQWKRGVTNIGTDSATYVAVTADLEQNITCTVTATNSFGNASQVSNTVVIVFNRLAHGLKWSVDTNNMTEVGTTTTLVDYFGNNSLSNPLATNQPLTVAGVLNGKSILRFTTDDILIKSVFNWFAADTSGQNTLVVKSNSDLLSVLFASADEASTRIWDVRKAATTGTFSHLHNSGNTQSGTIIGTSDLGETTWKVITVCSTGSAHKLFISSATETIASNTLTGGIWLADLPTQRDNITLGGLKYTSTSYSNCDIYGAYYGDYSTDAAIVQLHNELKQILGL